MKTPTIIENLNRRHALQAAGAITAGSLGAAMLPSRVRLDDIGAIAPKAKRVIYLYQAGAPSQLDMFDYKPALKRWHGKSLPNSVRQGQRLTEQTAGQESLQIAASPWKFRQRGRSGIWMSELMPHTARIADDICMIKSVHTEAINHVQGASFLLTGNERAGSPSIGAWLSYALGQENPNLPASAVMISHGTALGTGGQPVLDRYWSNGFLPSEFRAVKFRSSGDPVLYLNNPAGVEAKTRRNMMSAIRKLNKVQSRRTGDPEVQSRTNQYEMALGMQEAVPALADFSDEPERSFVHYGPDSRTPGTYAANCLLARRMAEQGVRFIQLCHRGWDTHSNNNAEVAMQCRDVDQPSAALVEDLRMRGMLDETLVIFGSEFGRTVYSQGDLEGESFGRDHHPRCFSMWLAGGGIKPGISYGETDELGYNVVADPVHIHDLNATILQCVGIDHEKLTYRFQGRDQRLTDVGGRVLTGLMNLSDA